MSLTEAVSTVDKTKAAKEAANNEAKRAESEFRMAQDRLRKTRKDRLEADIAHEQAQTDLLQAARDLCP